MNILVTGLCLSRNLGGPAMGLTLEQQVKKHYPDAKLTFAIEETSWDIEKKWAKYYGFEIVRRDKLISYLATLSGVREIKSLLKGNLKFYRASDHFKKLHREFMEAYRKADVVIDLSGVTYIGDGVFGPLDALRDYSYFHYARANKKPFARFIQSFGPFRTFSSRVFARREFRHLDFIPARGLKSASYCREIVKDKKKVYDFPDIALLLQEAGDEWRDAYLDSKGLRAGDYIVLSPSAVITNTILGDTSKGIGQNHVESFYRIAAYFLEKGEKLFFLPHMYTPNKVESDRVICEEIADRLLKEGTDRNTFSVMSEDLDPRQAKAIIAGSKMAIVARYHALVAAISSLTPVITIGWNIKYFDLLEYYGLGKMAIDARIFTPIEILDEVKNRITAWEEVKVTGMDALKQKQEENIKKVNEAFNLLFKWIDRSINKMV